jgi:hypothetical protein
MSVPRESLPDDRPSDRSKLTARVRRAQDSRSRGFLELGLDIDDDATTGFKFGFGRKSTGYDFTMQVITGVEVKSANSSQTVSGSVEVATGPGRVGTPVVSCSVQPRSPLATKIASKHQGSLSLRVRSEIRGKKLIVRVPYERLGLERRKDVRVCVADPTIRMFGSRSLSPDALLTLR